MSRFWRAARRLRSLFSPGALILVYHRIGEARPDPWLLSVAPQRFGEHLEVLRKHWRPITLQRMAQALRDGRLPRRAVAVTFDDGYADNFIHARPLLERNNVPATVFLTTSVIGGKRGFWWDELAAVFLQPGVLPGQLVLAAGGTPYFWELGEAAIYSEDEFRRDRGWNARLEPPTARQRLYRSLWELLHPLPGCEQERIMAELFAWAGLNRQTPACCRTLTQAETIQLAQGDLIEIGAHTVNHLSLASLPPEVQREEILGSKAQLEALVNRPVRSFSYPYGKPQDYSAETTNLVREAGFTAACANISGGVTPQADPYQLPRLHVPDLDGDQFARWLSDKLQA